MRAWVAIGLMFVGAGLTAFGMVLERERDGETAVLVFGLLSFTMCSGATLWAGLKVYSWTTSRKAKHLEIWPERTEIPATYMARYSVQDRVVGSSLAMFLCTLTVFFAYHADHIGAILLSACLFCFSLWYAAHLIVSRVLFTRERITARILGHEELSEPYSNLRRVSSKPGTLTLHFSDGRSMRLYAGLGDSGTVIAYLSRYAPKRVVHNSEG